MTGGFLAGWLVSLFSYFLIFWALQGEELLEFIAQAQQGDARGWIHEAIAVLHHENLMRLVVTLWAIWYARRKVIHEELFQSPLSTHSFVEKFLS